MQVFFYLAFVVIIGIAIFSIQNSGASPVTIKFLIWKFETSLIYTILGSILLGILLTSFVCISRVLRNAFRKKSPGSMEEGE